MGDTVLGPTRPNIAGRLSDAEMDRPVDVGGELVNDDGSVASRYEAVATIGAGGMGEIRLCFDRRIGRQVAMKVIQRDQGSVSDARICLLYTSRCV